MQNVSKHRWASVDPPCAASFVVTLNSSALTTCSGKKWARVLHLLMETDLSKPLAPAAVLMMTCKWRVSLQCAAPGSRRSPNRYWWSCAHCAHTPPALVTFCCIRRLCPSLRWPHRCLGVSLPHISDIPRWLLCEVERLSEGFSVLLTEVWILSLSFLSALLGFLLLLATVRLKSAFSLEHFGVWIFLSKVIGLHGYAFRCDCFLKSDSENSSLCWCFPQVATMCLSPFIFSVDINVPSLLWWVFKDSSFIHLYFQLV